MPVETRGPASKSTLECCFVSRNIIYPTPLGGRPSERILYQISEEGLSDLSGGEPPLLGVHMCISSEHSNFLFLFCLFVLPCMCSCECGWRYLKSLEVLVEAPFGVIRHGIVHWPQGHRNKAVQHDHRERCGDHIGFCETVQCNWGSHQVHRRYNGLPRPH